MRDGIAIARNGQAAVALVTSEFWAQGNFVASSEGMPDVPRVELPHPVAGIGLEGMARVAESISEQVLARLSAA